ncbi:MAG: hypothetical protein FJY56_13575 [Betaproteobacteria bacterium]|nr:hypothetical protein [Betaproteobacteria bacterium]
MLPDPRRWAAPGASSPLAALTAKSLEGDAAARAALRLELDQLMEAGDDAALQTLLREAPSASGYRHLQQMLAKLVNKPDRGETVIARLFALPLVIVAGARKNLRLPEALPDINAVAALLNEHGVLGAARNFGLGNALVSLDTLACLPLSLLRAWAAQLRTGAAPLALAGSAIDIAPGREQVELRFVVGASVTPAHVPSVMETGSNVGAWGMPLTILLAQQLAQPALDVLPIARAPAALYLAADAGRAAQIELAFNLFLSNTVRRFRMAVGDPAVVLSAHRDQTGAAEFRVSLSSAFDESLLEGFRWPLYPADDHLEIINKIKYLLDECRLSDMQLLAQVAGDVNARGGRFFALRDVTQALRAH